MRGAATIPKLVLSGWHLFRDLEKDVIRQHIVRAFIIQSRHIVSPLQQHLQHSQLIRRMSVSASFNDGPVAVILDCWLLVGFHGKSIGLVEGAAEESFRVQGVTLDAFLEKVESYSIIDVEQIVGIFPSVLAHLLGQWPHTPISKLVLLVGKYRTVGLQEIGKTKLFHAKGACSLTCIEHVD